MQRTTLPPVHPTEGDLDADAVRLLVREHFADEDADELYGVASVLTQSTDGLGCEDFGLQRAAFRRALRLKEELRRTWDLRFPIRGGMLKAFALARVVAEESGGVAAELAAYRAERAAEGETLQGMLDAALQPHVVAADGCMVPADGGRPGLFRFVLLDAAGEEVDGLTVRDDPASARPLAEAAQMIAEQLAIRGLRVRMHDETAA